jgi:superoxide dismutase, Cu-Zn family
MKATKKARTRLATMALALLLSPSLAVAQDDEGHEGHEGHGEPATAAPVTRAIAVMHATEGNDVSGTVTFEQTDGGVRVQANLSGLSPGAHGFHVHQWGDCSASDGESAGGHFNPTGAPHAGPEGHPRHVGDLGNIEAGDDGNASYDRVDEHLRFEGAHSVLGRALIVHADPDDLTSQPTGGAGARLACGVIGVAAPQSAE